jgi:23S rRNA pseudouridine1911/1915/1917 synthase
MLDGLLRERDPSLSWADARALVTTGKVFCDGAPALEPARRVRAGVTIEVRPNAPRPAARGRLDPAALAFVDRQVAVVRKPAGVSTVPFDPGEEGTLDQLVRALLDRQARARGGPAQGWIGVVHRLDKGTTGLLVFARTLAAKKHLANQFRFHSVERRYVALAHGRVSGRTIRSRLVADRGDGLRGSTRSPSLGQEAVTHVEPLEHFAGATLVACRLETGRTHQIRIHLAEAGHPLLGEDVYVRRYRGERIDAPRPMLHAEELGFEHPSTGAPMHFRDDWPDDFVDLVERLRAATLDDRAGERAPNAPARERAPNAPARERAPNAPAPPPAGGPPRGAGPRRDRGGAGGGRPPRR